MQSRLPVIGDFVAFARAGALFSLGVEEAAGILRRVAYFVDRILKAAKPAELPIEYPNNFRSYKASATLKLLIGRESNGTLNPGQLFRVSPITSLPFALMSRPHRQPARDIQWNLPKH